VAWLEGIRGKPRVPHVKILIPHWGSVSLEWAKRTFAPLDRDPQPDFEKQTILMRGILNLDTERNELVRVALEDPRTTHILFLDTDVIVEQPPDPNQALRMLLACNAPIASALYRAKQKTGFSYAMWVKNPRGEGYLPVREWTGNWIRVDTIGLGFCLIKREVFEKVPYPWFKWDKPAPSEDFYFCEQVAKYGFEIRVLTDVKCSHIGTLKVKPDGEISVLDV
jgi:hypothetical protein